MGYIYNHNCQLFKDYTTKIKIIMPVVYKKNIFVVDIKIKMFGLRDIYEKTDVIRFFFTLRLD